MSINSIAYNKAFITGEILQVETWIDDVYAGRLHMSTESAMELFTSTLGMDIVEIKADRNDFKMAYGMSEIMQGETTTFRVRICRPE